VKRSGFKTRSKPLERRAQLRAVAPAKAEVPLIRMRKCPVKKGGCGAMFRPERKAQLSCLDCAVAVGGWLAVQKAKAVHKEDVKQTRAKLEALKPLQHWLKKAEKAVNRYVRARDFHRGCISCDLPANWNGQWHASHFRSVGAASAVRFCLWNIHRACWICNKLYSGRIDAYTPSITQRIGQERVDWLRAQNQRVDYRREYLQRLASVFNKKAARQEKRNAMQG
jgi:hypothetical protein